MNILRNNGRYCLPLHGPSLARVTVIPSVYRMTSLTDTRDGIYFTQPYAHALPGIAVYCVNPDGKVIRVTDWNEFDTPNGCMMSPDGSLFYLGDFSKRSLWVFDINDDGTLSNKRPFGEIILGDERQGAGKSVSPKVDGMILDTTDNLYIGHAGGQQNIPNTKIRNERERISWQV